MTPRIGNVLETFARAIEATRELPVDLRALQAPPQVASHIAFAAVAAAAPGAVPITHARVLVQALLADPQVEKLVQLTRRRGGDACDAAAQVLVGSERSLADGVVGRADAPTFERLLADLARTGRPPLAPEVAELLGTIGDKSYELKDALTNAKKRGILDELATAVASNRQSASLLVGAIRADLHLTTLIDAGIGPFGDTVVRALLRHTSGEHPTELRCSYAEDIAGNPRAFAELSNDTKKQLLAGLAAPNRHAVRLLDAQVAAVLVDAGHYQAAVDTVMNNRRLPSEMVRSLLDAGLVDFLAYNFDRLEPASPSIQPFMLALAQSRGVVLDEPTARAIIDTGYAVNFVRALAEPDSFYEVAELKRTGFADYVTRHLPLDAAQRATILQRFVQARGISISHDQALDIDRRKLTGNILGALNPSSNERPACEERLARAGFADLTSQPRTSPETSPHFPPWSERDSWPY